MKLKKMLRGTVITAILISGLMHVTHAAVTITPATGGTCLNLAPGAYKVLSNIFVSEAAVGDIAIQAGTTFILTAPAGTEFRPATGNVIFTAGRDITAATVTVTTTTVTVTLTVPTNTKLDAIRIRNIQVRSTAAGATGNILRTATGGTAVITGDAPGGGVGHGYLTTNGTGGTITSISNGNWSSPGTWSGGSIPGCSDNVIIGHTVTVDALVTPNNVTVNTGGNLVADNPVVIGGTFTLAGTGIYTHNNTTDAATTIFNGTESFASSSTIIINNWSDYLIPLPTGVTGDFGAITINTATAWNQSGLFAPARIKGTLTINNGTITMDDGTGMTTALTLQDVIISGAGRFIGQSGTPRNLDITTGNFTDNGPATIYSYINYRAVATLNWTVNGNLTISHRFMVMEGASAGDVGSATVQVNGNFSIIGGTFYGVRNLTGGINFTVTGTSSITGTPALVAFKENYTGDINFQSGSFSINSGSNNNFMRGNGSVGAVTVAVTGDLNVTGANTRVYLNNGPANSNPTTLSVSHDFTLTDAQFYTATTIDGATITVGNDYTQSGATSVFYGQRSTSATGNVNVTVNATMGVSSGAFVMSQGTGTIDLDVVETLALSNCSFYGMNNTSPGNNGGASLSVADLDFSGSTFYLHRGEITDGRTITVNVANQMSVNFTAATQSIFFVARAAANNALLNLNIGSNLFVSGSADGLFCTSMSEGIETVNIGGDLSVSAGRVRFNSYENSSARGHDVNGTITGSLLVSGGSICLSSNKFNSTWNINGDYDQTGGKVIFKWHTGAGTYNVLGNLTTTNALMYLYSRSVTPNASTVQLIVNGNASFESTTIVFDSCQTSTATHRMTLKGANVTYGSNIIFTHLAHLTVRTIFGSIVYDRPGTITLKRNAASYDIRQVKQTITAGTTVDFSTSPFDLMIASHTSSTSATHTTLDINGTLNMGTKMISARQQANYYSSLNVNSGARLITAHTGGLYSGSASNSAIFSQINGSNRMNYYLDANSTVEYNGTDNQVITGTGQGIATTTNHRYGKLDINFTGTPDVEFTYPFDDNVFVRTNLMLTTGELNLDNDHVTNTGGRVLNVLNGATINRVDGYIRSETEDGSGTVNWNITTTGSFVVPFGYNSSEYIPFTYQPTSGSSGDVALATYHSASDNTPLPPTVTHVRDMVGADNSPNTVDRFWRIAVPGSVTVNLTFSSTNAERVGLSNPRAQLWEPVSQGWFPPSGVQSNPTISTTLASGISGLNSWWTLSSSSTPLPVELISFNAGISGNSVKLEWTTASEINNDFFTIERGADGVHFEDIAVVDGAGNSTSNRNYKNYDTEPLSGVNYYRLRQTDFDGRESYSPIRLVTFTKLVAVHVYPNPVEGPVINIGTDEASGTIQSVNLFDLAGKLITLKQTTYDTFRGGETTILLDETIGKGTYVLEVNTTQGVFREMIVRQ